MKRKKINPQQCFLFYSEEENLIKAKTGLEPEEFKNLYGEKENFDLIESFKKQEQVSDISLEEFLNLNEKKTEVKNLSKTPEIIKENKITKSETMTKKSEEKREKTPNPIALLIPEKKRKEMEETRGTSKIELQIGGKEFRISHFQSVWSLKYDDLRTGWQDIDMNAEITIKGEKVILSNAISSHFKNN